MVAVWTHWAAPKTKQVSLSFPDGILESQKVPFCLCKNTRSIFTVISCKKISAAVGQGRREVWLCHPSGLLAVAACSERKGDFLGAERSFEMFTLREWGHLLAEGKCQGFLPAHVCFGQKWETELSVGFLTLRAMEPLAASPRP